MHIYFCLRKDALTKPGGDSLKIQHYSKSLKLLGITSSIVTDAEQLPEVFGKNDLLHLFNTQVPYENFKYFKIAIKKSVTYFFSSIHHQNHFTELFLCKSYFGRMIGLSGMLFLKALFKELMVYKRINNLSSFVFGPNFINKKIILGARYVIPLSNSEFDHLVHDFGLMPEDISKAVTPNGLINFDLTKNEIIHNRENDIVIVGRIEPRKNQLKLAKMLSKSKYKCIFVGSLNTNHKKYTKKFEKCVSESDNLKYIGFKNKTELKSYYLQSKVCLSNSWFEVVSQVDLEACVYGCKVIISEASAIKDYFTEDPLSLFPDDDEEKIIDTIERALKENYKPKIKSAYNKNWSEISEDLIKLYTKAH